jgi:hypothetical protein
VAGHALRLVQLLTARRLGIRIHAIGGPARLSTTGERHGRNKRAEHPNPDGAPKARLAEREQQHGGGL